MRIDIDKWGSPVAQRYEIRRVPTLWLFEGRELRSEDTQEVIEFLHRG